MLNEQPNDIQDRAPEGMRLGGGKPGADRTQRVLLRAGCGASVLLLGLALLVPVQWDLGSYAIEQSAGFGFTNPGGRWFHVDRYTSMRRTRLPWKLKRWVTRTDMFWLSVGQVYYSFGIHRIAAQQTARGTR